MIHLEDRVLRIYQCFWTRLFSKFSLHTLASQLKAKKYTCGPPIQRLKNRIRRKQNKKALEYNMDILTILYGVIPLKTNNFPVVFSRRRKTHFSDKAVLSSDIRFPTSAYFNLSHERELIWLANHDLPAMAGISRDRSNHLTKQKLKCPRYLK